MLLFIIMTLIFKSCLALPSRSPYPFITKVHLTDDLDGQVGEVEELYRDARRIDLSEMDENEADYFLEVYEDTSSDEISSPKPLVVESDETLIQLFPPETTGKCQVYENKIQQIFELVDVDNSTAAFQYRLLRNTIEDLHLFDICYEEACVGASLHRRRAVTRRGRFFHNHKGFDLNLELEKWNSKDRKVTVENDFCRYNDFCRTCPYHSSCCDDWCWKTCYDEDIRNPSYCQIWTSSDLCKKISHCQCNLDHGECFGGGTKKAPSRVSPWGSGNQGGCVRNRNRNRNGVRPRFRNRNNRNRFDNDY